MYRYFDNIMIDKLTESVSYNMSTIIELPMDWSTNTISSNFDQINSEAKIAVVTLASAALLSGFSGSK